MNLEKAPDDVSNIDQVSEELSAKDITVIRLAEFPDRPELDGILDDAFWGNARSLQIGKDLDADVKEAEFCDQFRKSCFECAAASRK